MKMVSGMKHLRRPPHGGRGLKYERRYGRGLLLRGRPPHGGRGLKFSYYFGVDVVLAVAPRTGGVD